MATSAVVRSWARSLMTPDVDAGGRRVTFVLLREGDAGRAVAGVLPWEEGVVGRFVGRFGRGEGRDQRYQEGDGKEELHDDDYGVDAWKSGVVCVEMWMGSCSRCSERW